jgi:hypothetical protein
VTLGETRLSATRFSRLTQNRPFLAFTSPLSQAYSMIFDSSESHKMAFEINI